MQGAAPNQSPRVAARPTAARTSRAFRPSRGAIGRMFSSLQKMGSIASRSRERAAGNQLSLSSISSGRTTALRRANPVEKVGRRRAVYGWSRELTRRFPPRTIRSLSGGRVARALDAVIGLCGRSLTIVGDNGTKLICPDPAGGPPRRDKSYGVQSIFNRPHRYRVRRRRRRRLARASVGHQNSANSVPFIARPPRQVRYPDDGGDPPRRSTDWPALACLLRTM